MFFLLVLEKGRTVKWPLLKVTVKLLRTRRVCCVHDKICPLSFVSRCARLDVNSELFGSVARSAEFPGRKFCASGRSVSEPFSNR
eukprot:scaffold2510_cov169-Amphora_coffeaeformis.AAC.59